MCFEEIGGRQLETKCREIRVSIDIKMFHTVHFWTGCVYGQHNEGLNIGISTQGNSLMSALEFFYGNWDHIRNYPDDLRLAFLVPTNQERIDELAITFYGNKINYSAAVIVLEELCLEISGMFRDYHQLITCQQP
ncbi:uncharacterized protein LOC126469884 [Schistocerca serialis cubense]|uniref:uncharacterized protein LOC126469884 n=1 Tax=Schistocerca serialis cubense TaxID=2023355 RepID=UPI00214E3449|nr:uncharacterized protein LOC126469884 [Schistocerca serialis cubense]